VNAAPAIRIRGLSAVIDGREILHGIDAEVPHGACVSVIGPNGAGKTTLLRCLLRLVNEWSGSIEIDGRCLGSCRQRELALVLSYVPQADGRSYPFTVREFVAMSRYPHQGAFAAPGEADRQAVGRALDLTGMAGLADRLMDTLSGGERQEALIAAALAQEARILLLDEPTAFMDYRHQVRIREILRQVRTETGAAIVMVTHDANAAIGASDAVLALRDGAVTWSGSAERLADPAVLRTIYGIDFLLTAHPGSGRPLAVPREAT
jgi:iron complex transport system ATP-binding protein